MKLSESIVAELEIESQTTKRVLEHIPEDKLSWKPHAKSHSLGQLALHIASAPGNVAMAAAKDVAELPNFVQPQPKDRREIFDAFSKSLAEAKETLNRIDDTRMKETWSATRNGKVMISVPRIGFIRSILLNHLYHHRGQLSVYLRLLDVPVPSIYGPSADESPFA
jgi:uncharacterized damage-inducible protein DinB